MAQAQTIARLIGVLEIKRTQVRASHIKLAHELKNAFYIHK